MKLTFTRTDFIPTKTQLIAAAKAVAPVVVAGIIFKFYPADSELVRVVQAIAFCALMHIGAKKLEASA